MLIHDSDIEDVTTLTVIDTEDPMEETCTMMTTTWKTGWKTHSTLTITQVLLQVHVV